MKNLAVPISKSISNYFNLSAVLLVGLLSLAKRIFRRDPNDK